MPGLTRRDLHCLLLLFSLPALFFFFPFFLGRVFYVGDITHSFRPWLTYAAQEMQRGRLPLWNPYSACGEPFLANPQIMLFSPTALPFWTLPTPAAWGLFYFLNQALLTLAAFLLARRFGLGRGPASLCTLAIAWGGFTAVYWEFPSAAATIPWVVFFILVSWPVIAKGASSLCFPWVALATGFLFFSGYSQFAYYAVLAGGAIVLARAVRAPRQAGVFLGLWGAGAALGLMLSACQVLLTWETVGQSLRAGMDLESGRGELLNPFFLIRFLIPSIFDKVALPMTPTVFDPRHWAMERNWLATFFLGVAPLPLAAASLRRIREPRILFLWAGIFFSAAMAMGVEPLFTAMRAVVPGMRYMTHFANIMLLAVVCLALLAGAGLMRLRKRDGFFWTAWGFLTGVSLVLWWSGAARDMVLKQMLGYALSPPQHVWVAQQAAHALLPLLLTAGMVFLPTRLRTASLLVLTFGQLWLFGRDLQRFAPSRALDNRVALADQIDGEKYRLAFTPQAMQAPSQVAGNSILGAYQSTRALLRPNTHLPLRAPEAWAFEVFPLQQFSEFRRRAVVAEKPSPVIDFLGVSHLITYQALPEPYKFLAQRPNALLYANPGALPRVTWVPWAVSQPNRDERLHYIETNWKPAQEVILEEPLAHPGNLSSAAGPLRFWKEQPGRLISRGESPSEGWLVWSQTFFPGWEVFVNNRPARLWRANHAFQAVQTPAGPWRAVFVYRPKIFRIGLCATLTAFLGVGFLLWRTLKHP